MLAGMVAFFVAAGSGTTGALGGSGKVVPINQKAEGEGK